MNIEDLKETAALAHLNLDEAELESAFPAFEQMLGFFAAMQAADKDEAAFPVPIGGNAGQSRPAESGFFRPDAGSAGTGQVSGLLDNAGERDGGFVVVPNVL
ncbi:MAG: aspartyl/glutamyl-tRNA amidotransferase subunit C [Spirochaetaceae bacterium]|jgi:aspartyl-tRNA(Asn)/glutamyl-tRNA(Gln) amidotransferase subunit C|nr:aspartyl/glutamyl-tRNA amidotransferase subunit C [Spirochaetaceae bacterium]